MKKQLFGFALGVICSSIAFTAAPALASSLQTIEATINSVNIQVNGEMAAATGENYTLSDGSQTAGSIVYNNTTYVPIRRIGDLLGADIGWDQSSSSVTIQGKIDKATPSTNSSAAVPVDYSDWTAEEEAAYQEFKAMWTLQERGNSSAFTRLICAKDNIDSLKSFLQNRTEDIAISYSNRLSSEMLKIITSPTNPNLFLFCIEDGGNDLWIDTCYNTGTVKSDYKIERVLELLAN